MRTGMLVGKGMAFIGAFVLALGFSLGSARAEEKGLESFKDRKCTECHALSSAGIGKPAQQAPLEPGERESPDLAKLSDDVMKKPDPVAFIVAYLKKKEDLHDVKHKKMFKGDVEELTTLAKFLVDNAKKKVK